MWSILRPVIGHFSLMDDCVYLETEVRRQQDASKDSVDQYSAHGLGRDRTIVQKSDAAAELAIALHAQGRKEKLRL